MSERATTALGGVITQGYVTVREAPLQGMITVRADLCAKPVATALKAVTGAGVPQVRRMTQGANAQVAWMAPDELLILCAYAEAAEISGVLSNKLGRRHHLCAVVSDARAMFDIDGAAADEVLAKLAPVDTTHLQPNEMRRTRLAQVAAAVWRRDNGLRVVCFRSNARYVFEALSTASQPGGEVFSGM